MMGESPPDSLLGSLLSSSSKRCRDSYTDEVRKAKEIGIETVTALIVGRAADAAGAEGEQVTSGFLSNF